MYSRVYTDWPGGWHGSLRGPGSQHGGGHPPAGLLEPLPARADRARASGARAGVRPRRAGVEPRSARPRAERQRRQHPAAGRGAGRRGPPHPPRGPPPDRRGVGRLRRAGASRPLLPVRGRHLPRAGGARPHRVAPAGPCPGTGTSRRTPRPSTTCPARQPSTWPSSSPCYTRSAAPSTSSSGASSATRWRRRGSGPRSGSRSSPATCDGTAGTCSRACRTSRPWWSARPEPARSWWRWRSGCRATSPSTPRTSAFVEDFQATFHPLNLAALAPSLIESRAVRPPQGQLHRRDRRLRGAPPRPRAGAHRLPGRDRGRRGRRAGEAPAGAAGPRLPAGRRHRPAALRRQDRRRHQPRPGARRPRRRLPRGPLLPAVRRRHRHPGPGRAARRRRRGAAPAGPLPGGAAGGGGRGRAGGGRGGRLDRLAPGAGLRVAGEHARAGAVRAQRRGPRRLPAAGRRGPRARGRARPLPGREPAPRGRAGVAVLPVVHERTGSFSATGRELGLDRRTVAARVAAGRRAVSRRRAPEQ